MISARDNKWMLKVWELLHAQSERYRQVCLVRMRDALQRSALFSPALSKGVKKAVKKTVAKGRVRVS
jgi:hypothetical protein